MQNRSPWLTLARFTSKRLMKTRFPALRIAREAGVHGGPYPTILSAADEIAVEAFVAGRHWVFGHRVSCRRNAFALQRSYKHGFDLIADVDQLSRADAAAMINSRAT